MWNTVTLSFPKASGALIDVPFLQRTFALTATTHTGKGMRTCYNDKDLKEAWVLSKAEALKFFSDGAFCGLSINLT